MAVRLDLLPGVLVAAGLAGGLGIAGFCAGGCYFFLRIAVGSLGDGFCVGAGADAAGVGADAFLGAGSGGGDHTVTVAMGGLGDLLGGM
jgi:hypothetical protein